jgi:formamidopyrimidine-DNA glycosylase
MPELPEVETIRRQLAPRVTGRTLERVRVLDERWCMPLRPAEMERALRGRRVESLGRRGKYLVWSLSGDRYLLQHLRMTGNLLYDPAVPPVHTRVEIELDDGHRLLYADARRFGTGQLADGPDGLAEFLDSRLGLEPFDPVFGAMHLRSLARGSRAPVKAFLLDQKRVAGVGNIYADEALFRARVHPLRPAGRVTPAQWDALAPAIVETLQAGIAANGASIDDFRDVDGAYGSFQDEFLIHLHEGDPCPRCGAPVKKIVAAGRGTYVCERCQPRPRMRRRS